MRIYALQQTDEESYEAKLLRTVKPHTTPVVTVAVDATSSLLATGAADGSIKVWDLRGGYTTHTFHGHSGVISALCFFAVDAAEAVESKSKKKKKNKQKSVTGEDEVPQDEATAGYRLASGGEDGKIRIWDLHKRKSAAALDAHASVVRGLSFSAELRTLLSAGRDKTAMLWDSRTWSLRSTIAILEGVESAGFVEGGRYFYTGGENARLRIWSTETGDEVTEEQESGVETEAILDVLNHPGLPFALSVHADQTILLHSLAPLSQTITERIPALPIMRRISGTHDEVIDLAYVGPNRDHLALATNLEDIRIISLARPSSNGSTNPYFGADVALLKSHKDIIITLSVSWSGHWLATGAKDNSAKLWRLDPENDSYTCWCTFTGHAESIGAVALPSANPPAGSKEHLDPLGHPSRWLVTGSQDKTVKLWDIPREEGGKARARYTRKAHDKDINAIAISYSNTAPLFASASQDRTVKIWDVESGESIGVLRGHKRGVWTVAFSPLDMLALTMTGSGGATGAKGMVLTGSGDKTVRIWSLSDYSCVRTFEGHSGSVLKVVWLPAPRKGERDGRGCQVASAAGDGLVKIWDAQGGECATTLDNHIDRVWALAVKPSLINSSSVDETMKDADAAGDESGDNEPPLELLSGSADSTLTFWHDTSSLTQQATTLAATARVEQDQELQNHIRSSNYREAIVLALQLNHPRRLLELFTAVVDGDKEADSVIGKHDVDEILRSGLGDSQLWTLIKRVRDWNANARTFHVAQRILHALLMLVPKERLLRIQDPRRRRQQRSIADDELADGMQALTVADESGGGKKESMKDVLDGLRAYTQKRVERHQRTAEERWVLVWALEQMSSVAADGEGDVQWLLTKGNGIVNGVA